MATVGRQLGIQNNDLGEGALVVLRGCKKLVNLSIDQKDLTDDAIEALAQIGSLERLRVHSEAMAKSEVEVLERRLPGVDVTVHYPSAGGLGRSP